METTEHPRTIKQRLKARFLNILGKNAETLTVPEADIAQINENLSIIREELETLFSLMNMLTTYFNLVPKLKGKDYKNFIDGDDLTLFEVFERLSSNLSNLNTGFNTDAHIKHHIRTLNSIDFSIYSSILGHFYELNKGNQAIKVLYPDHYEPVKQFINNLSELISSLRVLDKSVKQISKIMIENSIINIQISPLTVS